MRKQKTALFALMLALCIALSGCSLLPEALQDRWEDVIAPLPAADGASHEAPVGDVAASDIARVTLYYPSADGAMLTPVTRLFWLNGAQTAEERAAEEMLQAPVGADIASAAWTGARLGWMEKTGRVLTLNLLCETEPEDDGRKTATAAALTATFTGMDDIEAVNLLINGRAAALCGLPAGTLCTTEEQPARWRQHLTEEAALFKNEGEKVGRVMTVYCPSLTSDLVAPELREVWLDTENGAYAALTELMRRPQSAGLTNCVPDIEGALAQAPEVREIEGQRVLCVYYAPQVFDALEASPVQRWQFLAAQVLTLTTFCPQIDGVRVYFGEYYVSEAPDSEGNMVPFSAGILRRSDFAPQLGAVVKAFFADAAGRLTAEERVIGSADAGSARALIAMLMDGPDSPALLRTLPAGLTAADILGVTVRDGVLELNLSARFYARCQVLDAGEERLAVYSLVNTAAVNGLAQAVRIYIEGTAVDTLAGTISLRGALMPWTGEGLPWENPSEQ